MHPIKVKAPINALKLVACGMMLCVWKYLARILNRLLAFLWETLTLPSTTMRPVMTHSFGLVKVLNIYRIWAISVMVVSPLMNVSEPKHGLKRGTLWTPILRLTLPYDTLKVNSHGAVGVIFFPRERVSTISLLTLPYKFLGG